MLGIWHLFLFLKLKLLDFSCKMCTSGVICSSVLILHGQCVLIGVISINLHGSTEPKSSISSSNQDFLFQISCFFSVQSVIILVYLVNTTHGDIHFSTSMLQAYNYANREHISCPDNVKNNISELHFKFHWCFLRVIYILGIFRSGFTT